MSRTVSITKSSPDMKLGVRLAGGSGKIVKVVEINPAGPLASLLKKNDVLESINGVPCNQGHEKAAAQLKAVTGELVLVVNSKKPSITQRLSGKRFSSGSTKSLSQSTSFTTVDKPAALEDVVMSAPTPAPAAPPAPVAVVPAPAAVPMPPVATSPVKVASVSPRKPAVSAVVKMDVDPPSPRAPAVAPKPTTPKAPVPTLAADEYSVVLQRNKTASIGMRLVQKKHTDLPYIQDIDPLGPAAKTDIAVGDILLEVNGVDARASHEELKKALGTTDAAVLKLRRVPSSSTLKPPSVTEAAARKPVGQADDKGGFNIFGCCAARPIRT